MAKRIYELEVNNIFFRYAFGNTHLAIWTKQKGQYSEAVPNHFKMSFAISTPTTFLDPDNPIRIEDMNDHIDKLIRDKAAAQKKANKHVAMKIEQKKERKRQKKKSA